jgi:hypothetical protein
LDTLGGTDIVQIWFGTISHPPAAPADYNNSAGVLKDDELMTGAVHLLEWSAATGLTVLLSRALYPGPGTPRGASGVVGLKVGNVLPEPVGQPARDELVVGTLSGDIIIYDADSMVEIWRTFIPGAVGMFNSIVLADLDQNGDDELYLAGSWGIHRLTL